MSAAAATWVVIAVVAVDAVVLALVGRWLWRMRARGAVEAGEAGRRRSPTVGCGMALLALLVMMVVFAVVVLVGFRGSLG